MTERSDPHEGDDPDSRPERTTADEAREERATSGVRDEPDLADYRALFGLASTHSLEAAAGRRTHRAHGVRETRWFEERDPSARLIACYRTWRERAHLPPYRTEFGWERFSPRGELLAREVRFSTRASVAALH